MNPVLIKYLCILGICLFALIASYEKGYQNASDKYEKQVLAAQVELANKISAVEIKSTGIAEGLVLINQETSTKLNTLLANTKGKPLTTTPCKPTTDFSSAWNEINRQSK